MNKLDKIKSILTFLFLLIFGFYIYGQSSNVDCNNAFEISDPTDFCSGLTEFDNTGAGESGFDPPDCWNEAENDLWFTFVARGKAVNIVVNGEVGGTLDNPQVVLYRGDCGQIIDINICESILFGDDIATIFYPDLTIGNQYYVRVDGRNGDQGTFQICVSNYNLPIEPGQDCNTASILCSKETIVVQNVTGAGIDPDEADDSCLDPPTGGDSETRSTWFKWTCGSAGTLTFEISPLSITDDYDFALFRINGGIEDCDLEQIRCSATFGGDFEPCGPNTGLDLISTDLEEDWDCDPGEDGFVQFVDMLEGESYALVINNFSQSEAGMSLSFGGTGTFLEPEVELFAEPMGDEICLRDALVSANTNSATVNIVEYNWDFGEGSTPESANNEGPHMVNYNSLGDKTIVLTAITDLGCQVTETITFFVDSCCQDVAPVTITIDSLNDQVCNNEGFVEVSASGGFGNFQYNFQGGDFSGLNSFSNLGTGNYEIVARDERGCESTIAVDIVSASGVIVDAGDDITIDLGQENVQLDANSNIQEDITINWMPEEGLSCADSSLICLDPFVNIDSTTTFTITITDIDGCLSSDQVTVTVEVRVEEGDIYTPNVFSPNNDGFNDYFTIFADQTVVANIEELVIFDRWGNKVYDGKDLIPNDSSNGWDGRFDGTPAETGVYTWYAKLLFVDSRTDFIQGDLTLLR